MGVLSHKEERGLVLFPSCSYSHYGLHARWMKGKEFGKR